MAKIRFLFTGLLLLCTGLLYAQPATSANPVEMADTMRSNGKIYVVVAVVLIILAGLFIYLVSIDRKIGRLEKNMKEEEKK